MTKSAPIRLGQLASLLFVVGLFALLTHIEPMMSGSGVVVAVTGFLLLSGLLTSELFELVKLPHLTGYIAAGVIAGPYVLHFVDHATVKRLEIVNTLALALIALAGGLELRIADVRQVLRSLGIHSTVQTLLVLSTQAALFAALGSQVDFTRGLALPALIGVGLLWGVLAVSRSPSATLAILSQTRAKGPLSRFSLAFVMSSDVLVLVLMAATLSLVRPLIEPGSTASLKSLLAVGHELLGSISLGTTLGLVLIVYLRFAGSQILVLVVAIGFALSEGLRYLRFEPLLTFLTAGFVVQNLSSQGDKLLHSIEQTGSVVFIVFFATAGAHLDIPLLAKMWPIALSLCAGRFAATWIAHRIGAAWARDDPFLRRWGWASLVSQAGLTLGLSAVLARTFPAVGEGLRSLVVATVAINEVIGPIFFKLGLERGREVESAS
ncbi:MAG TPA: cation:proton antiporter [Polyangiales bacterium]|nr:cation:proton antiporter [Polyangiales bacterium]